MDVRKAKRALKIQQWKAIIEDRNGSGLTVAEYCRQNALSRDAYFYWLRIIRRSVLEQTETTLPQVADAPKFVELTVPPAQSQVQADSFGDASPSTLVLSVNGITVQVSENTSSALLARTLGVIRNA